ncbi:hypothetical protein D3C81_2190300 [compost metagenome]
MVARSAVPVQAMVRPASVATFLKPTGVLLLPSSRRNALSSRPPMAAIMSPKTSCSTL